MALSSEAMRRLSKELKSVKDLEKSSNKAIEVTLVDESLAHWTVKLSQFEEPLKSELSRAGAKGVTLSVKFDEKYPLSPPFVRVLSPKFKFRTGHVTVGGSICVELLTNSGSKDGWKSTISMESVLLTVRQLFIDGKAKIEHNGHYQSEEYARETYERVAMQHDWLGPRLKVIGGKVVELPRKRTMAIFGFGIVAVSTLLLVSYIFFYDQLSLMLVSS
jgi:ubiquitin-conjugating enzyme E2 Q